MSDCIQSRSTDGSMLSWVFLFLLFFVCLFLLLFFCVCGFVVVVVLLVVVVLVVVVWVFSHCGISHVILCLD